MFNQDGKTPLDNTNDDPLNKVLGLGNMLGNQPQGPQMPGGPQLNVPQPPVPGSMPLPPVDSVQLGGGSQSEDRPRDTHPNAQPATLNPNMGGSQPPQYGATPSQPGSPTPVASQPPQPYVPMPAPMLPAGAAPDQNRMLFGRAGGLLGGGLGVPGALGDEGPTADDIMQFMKYLGQPGGGR